MSDFRQLLRTAQIKCGGLHAARPGFVPRTRIALERSVMQR
jgi:hypothetical protein